MGARKIWAAYAAWCRKHGSTVNCSPAVMFVGILLIAGVAFAIMDWPLVEKIILAALAIVCLGLVSVVIYGLHRAGFWRLCGRLAVMAWTACPAGRPALRTTAHPVPADGSMIVGEFADGSPVTWKPGQDDLLHDSETHFRRSQGSFELPPVDRQAAADALASAAGFTPEIAEDNEDLPVCAGDLCLAVWDGTCWHLPHGAPALHGYSEHSLDPATLPRRVPRDADKWGSDEDLAAAAEHVLEGRAL